MKFIMKLDKDDCFTTAEIKDLSATEFLILNKALRKHVFGGEDRTIRDAMVAEIERGSNNPSSPLTAIDGAEDMEKNDEKVR